MLSLATRIVADRLASRLMALVDAICPIALAGGTPDLPDHAAHTLVQRLARLVAGLIQICNLGIRPRRPAAEAPNRPATTTPSRAPGRSPARRLPRRPGWLLAALPGLAPALASDLAALLADPALASLLAAAPTLDRPLRPILRSLGLTREIQPPEPVPPTDPPASAARRRTPSPRRPTLPPLEAHRRTSPIGPPPPLAQFVTI